MYNLISIEQRGRKIQFKPSFFFYVFHPLILIKLCSHPSKLEDTKKMLAHKTSRSISYPIRDSQILGKQK